MSESMIGEQVLVAGSSTAILRAFSEECCQRGAHVIEVGPEANGALLRGVGYQCDFRNDFSVLSHADYIRTHHSTINRFFWVCGGIHCVNNVNSRQLRDLALRTYTNAIPFVYTVWNIIRDNLQPGERSFTVIPLVIFGSNNFDKAVAEGCQASQRSFARALGCRNNDNRTPTIKVSLFEPYKPEFVLTNADARQMFVQGVIDQVLTQTYRMQEQVIGMK